jgi:hypothetical protein
VSTPNEIEARMASDRGRPLVDRLLDAAQLAKPDRARENLCSEAHVAIKELLAALVAMEDAFRHPQGDHDFMRFEEEALAVARAAIAKFKRTYLVIDHHPKE